MNQNRQNVKGIRLRLACFLMMVLSAILFVVILYSTYQVSVSAHALTEATNEYIYCEENALQISDASDYLTDQVRFYILSGDKSYVDNYFDEVQTAQRREQALENLADSQAEPGVLNNLETAVNQSNLLAQQEMYAIKLTTIALGVDITIFPQEIQDIELSAEDLALPRQGKLEKAQELVFGSDYESAKALISENVTAFISDVTQQTYERQQRSADRLEILTALQIGGVLALFLISILTFTLIIFLVVRPLRAYIQCIQADTALDIKGAYECRYLATTYNKMYAANVKSQQALRHRADHDPLTKLFNRGAFELHRQLLREQGTEPLAFLLIDVDQFKKVNDTYGHEVGDLVLKKVSHLLQAGFRANDVVARLGGDEFGVIMTKMTPEHASIIENKIDAFNKLLEHSDQNDQDDLPCVSLTAGVAFSPAGFTDELYSQADQALYQRKENGRCGCQFYVPEDQEPEEQAE
jgi:diguanylate cyclase (GGDEF)-like protein